MDIFFNTRSAEKKGGCMSLLPQLVFPSRKITHSVKWDAVSDTVIPMWIADMDFQCPVPILNELAMLIRHGILGYSIIPDSYFEAVIHWFNRRYSAKLTKKNIIPVSGVISALRAIILTFSSENDFVIIQTPVYQSFKSAIESCKRKVLCHPLLDISEDGYCINTETLDLLLRAKPKILVLCSPHNPVGRVWSKQELEIVSDFCMKNNILLVVNEIHCDLVMPNNKFISFASLGNENINNALILSSPTKTFNLSGLRGGNLFVFNETSKAQLIESFMRYGMDKLNSFYLAAAEVGYRHCEPWLNSAIKYIYNNYLYIIEFIRKELPLLTVTPLQATYLVWINYKNLAIDEDIFIKKLSNFILVMPSSIFCENTKCYFRMNIACDHKLIVKAMSALKEIILTL